MYSFYFAYGSNMNFDQMHVRCSGAIFSGPARLNNWEYYINSDGYAGIYQSDSNKVHGCLWQLKDEHLDALDKYEAVDQGYYDRRTIDILDEKESVKRNAIVYISNNSKFGTPTSNYQDAVIEGAVQVGLPEDYIDFLESWRYGPS